MSVTLKDVAKLAGVNFTLVSKYLNGSPQARMTSETRGRIDSALAVLKYRPSAAARSLRIGRSKTLGLLIGNLTNAYFAHYADFAMRCCADFGYQLLLGLYDGETGRKNALSNLFARGVDAVFSTDGSIFSPSGKSAGIEPGPEITPAMNAASGLLKGLGCIRVHGIFFPSSSWEKIFRSAAESRALSVEVLHAPFDETQRMEKLRTLCMENPSAVFTGGWQTAVMLEELLEKEFPDLRPVLLPTANCCGDFLKSPHISGVFFYSEREHIRRTVNRALCVVENTEQKEDHPCEKAVFLTRGEYLRRGLASGKFRLT